MVLEMTLLRQQHKLGAANARVRSILHHPFRHTISSWLLTAFCYYSYVVEDVQEKSTYLRYKQAGCEIVRVTDALAVVEEMSSSSSALEPFDMIFVDADKTRLLDYVDACVNNDRILKKGGFIIVDNVLWKGLVLNAGVSQGAITDCESDMTESELKKSRRARKLGNTMHQFNRAIARDDRLEVVILPLRDGISVIRKR